MNIAEYVSTEIHVVTKRTFLQCCPPYVFCKLGIKDECVRYYLI